MQAAATAVGFSAVLPAKGRPAARSTVVARVPATRRSVRAAAAAVVVAEPGEVDYVVEEPAEVDYVVEEPTEVDYSSRLSVFPMEACDLLGGDACIGQMYPEAKLAAAAPEASTRVDGVEREYLSYDEPKTVFPGEACDLLGGEFCEAPYLDAVPGRRLQGAAARLKPGELRVRAYGLCQLRLYIVETNMKWY